MRKKILNNKKGFTLVELLAVIVVLAIIILIAMPAVMQSMDKARRNALVTEANEIIKVAQSAYADKSMTGNEGIDVCYSIQDLVTEGYLDKNMKNYSGSVKLFIDESSGLVTTTIWISNGMYKLDGIPGADVDVSKIKSGTSVSSACTK